MRSSDPASGQANRRSRTATAIGLGLLLACAFVIAPTCAWPATLAEAQADRESVVSGLVAQYQLTLVVERKQADDREQQLIATAQARLLKARADLRAAQGDDRQARAALVAERASFAKVAAGFAAKDPTALAQIAAFKAQVEDVAAQATPEMLAALQQFADGDRVDAWPVLEALRKAKAAAVQAAANAQLAPDALEAATERETMLEHGEGGATTKEVLDLYDEAARLDPNSFWVDMDRAEFAEDLGDTVRTGAALQQAVKLARDDGQISLTEERLGQLSRAKGDLTDAAKAFDESLAAARKLAGQNPDPRLQLYVALILADVGSVKTDQGDGAGALAADKESLGIVTALAAKDPTNTLWTADVAQAEYRVGADSLALLEPEPAEAAFQDSLKLLGPLATKDPADESLQDDTAQSLSGLAAALGGKGDFAGSLADYKASLAIIQRLESLDPTNATFADAAAADLNYIGNVLSAAGKPADAAKYYADSRDAFKRLLDADPKNAEIERRYMVSLMTLGDAVAAGGDRASSAEDYAAALAIARTLAQADPTNLQIQSMLFTLLQHVGDDLAAKGDAKGAAEDYADSLTIARRLAAAKPADEQFQRSVGAALIKLTSYPESGVRWKDVADELLRMQALGMLKPDDEALLQTAERLAAQPDGR